MIKHVYAYFKLKKNYNNENKQKKFIYKIIFKIKTHPLDK